MPREILQRLVPIDLENHRSLLLGKSFYQRKARLFERYLKKFTSIIFFEKSATFEINKILLRIYRTYLILI